MGVQNFLRGEGGLARIRASGIKYISARSREREISRRIHSDDFMEKRFDRYRRCRVALPLFERSQWRVTIADNAMITIGNSTDASRAKKLRRIVRDRISIPSNASTNISDSGIRASLLPVYALYLSEPRPSYGGEEESLRNSSDSLPDPLLSPLLLDPRYEHRGP